MKQRFYNLANGKLMQLLEELKKAKATSLTMDQLLLVNTLAGMTKDYEVEEYKFEMAPLSATLSCTRQVVKFEDTTLLNIQE